ncbi:unnamed protein product, partial [Rotaria magnacalcarata]
MQQLYDAVLLYRQQLIEEDRQWLEAFDQLSTKDERQLAIKSRMTKRILTKPLK